MAKPDTSFSDWLSKTTDRRFAGLKAQAEAGNWSAVHGLEHGWQLIENASLDEAEKAALKQEAALAFVTFERQRSGRGGILGVSAFGLGVFLFMAATLGILALAIFEPLLIGAEQPDGQPVQPLLTRLADVEAARGLITFVFTVGVIALALIIVTANVTAREDDAVRFERSKEILTSLIAIMGTILGFYFGRADSDPPQPRQTEISQPAAAGDPADGGE